MKYKPFENSSCHLRLSNQKYIFLSRICYGMGFDVEKKEILDKYHLSLDTGVVDTDIQMLNEIINRDKNWVTTSSCYGRIILISKQNLRSKYETKYPRSYTWK